MSSYMILVLNGDLSSTLRCLVWVYIRMIYTLASGRSDFLNLVSLVFITDKGFIVGSRSMNRSENLEVQVESQA